MIARQLARIRKLAGIIAVPLWRRALFGNGVAAGVEHAIILRQLGAVQTVVDIGANRGQFALVARHCFPSARIESFEPLPGPSRVYRSVFNGDRNATLHEFAIGPASGKVTIHVSNRDDSSSLLPISNIQSSIFPGTAESGTSIVNVGPLGSYLSDHIIATTAFLKLDVQGFELQALIGCEDLLAWFTWVYVECSFIELYEGQAFADEVIAWLRERGFHLKGVYNVAHQKDGCAVQADFLFKKILIKGAA